MLGRNKWRKRKRRRKNKGYKRGTKGGQTTIKFDGGESFRRGFRHDPHRRRFPSARGAVSHHARPHRSMRGGGDWRAGAADRHAGVQSRCGHRQTHRAGREGAAGEVGWVRRVVLYNDLRREVMIRVRPVAWNAMARGIVSIERQLVLVGCVWRILRNAGDLWMLRQTQ